MKTFALFALLLCATGCTPMNSEISKPVVPVRPDTQVEDQVNTSDTTAEDVSSTPSDDESTSESASTSTSTPTTTSAAKTYTMVEVATHNNRSSCWAVINNTVYDLTSWIDRHPGGEKQILNLCGTDGSTSFTGQHEGEPKPEKMLAGFEVGTLQ